MLAKYFEFYINYDTHENEYVDSISCKKEIWKRRKKNNKREKGVYYSASDNFGNFDDELLDKIVKVEDSSFDLNFKLNSANEQEGKHLYTLLFKF